ncbi:hypothetical protein [Pedobacter sp.]|uniref:baeRF7 domain-containing protein n=1 Tax=Pedobacter sp. TaxID=1411316 RepID=UPI003D7F2A94
MDILSREELKELINFHGDHCASIYIPTHRKGVAVNEKQDAIIFKNALQTTKNLLEERGLKAPQIEQLLSPCFDLYKNSVFWNNQQEGLAVFLAAGFLKVVQLPIKVIETTFVNSSFLISPLLPAVISHKEFYLLLLSKHDVKFFQGNEYGLQRLEVSGLPNGLDDVVHFEEKEDQDLFRRGSGGGDRFGSFHGQGEQLDNKANIALYFQEVDKTLFTEVLHDKNKPLLLAGVEYLIPIYKGLSKYKYITETALTGNKAYEDSLALFQQSKALLSPFFEQQANAALKNYYNQIATSNTSSMIEKIIPASYNAQVSDLFICENTHIWGKYNELEQTVEIHDKKQAGDICLLNKAAARTFINGGNVYVLNKLKMPKESVIAATFRF